MKKVIGIFMTMVMVFTIFGMAFGDGIDELREFVLSHKELRTYVSEEGYNIVGDTAYGTSNIGRNYEDMYDFMERYETEYLKVFFPELYEDADIEYTYVGKTEHYTIICVWLSIDNGKTMKDYCDVEPAVSTLSVLVAFEN